MEINSLEKCQKMYDDLKALCEEKKFRNSLVALPLAWELHKDTKRKGGDPYIIHPLSVAKYIVSLGFDSDEYIAASLLHDVVEDEGYDISQEKLDDEVIHDVDLLTFYNDPNIGKHNSLVSYYDDIYQEEKPTFIKFADRFHNLSTMGVFSRHKQFLYAEETKYFYYPALERAKELYPSYTKQILFFQSVIQGLVSMTESSLGCTTPFTNQPSETSIILLESDQLIRSRKAN